MRIGLYRGIPSSTDLLSHYEADRIGEEAEKLNIELLNIYREDIIYHPSKSEILIKSIPINQFDGFIFRLGAKYDIDNVGNILYKLNKLNIPFLNSEHLNNFLYGYNKLIQYTLVKEYDIPFPKTSVISSNKEFISFNDENYILKPSIGFHGRDVLPNNERNREFLLKNYSPDEIIIQKRIVAKNDYRVIILNGRSLGVMKRTSSNGSLTTNISLGGIGEKAEDKKLEDMAIKIAGIFKVDYAGVDLILDEDNNPYFLEINRNAQFRGFENALGVNVAEKILEFMKNKISSLPS